MRRALAGRWFWFAVLATFGTMLVAVGRELLYLEDWPMYRAEPP